MWTNNTHNTHTNEHTNTRQCVYNLCTWFAEQLVTDLYNCVHFYSTRYLFLVLVLRRFSSVLSNSMDFCYGSNAINIHFGAFFIFFFLLSHTYISISISISVSMKLDDNFSLFLYICCCCCSAVSLSRSHSIWRFKSFANNSTRPIHHKTKYQDLFHFHRGISSEAFQKLSSSWCIF